MITIKRLILCAVVTATAIVQTARAQTTTTTTTVVTTTIKEAPVNNYSPTVYVELGGPGLIVSGNYDMRFAKRKDGIGGRVGIGFIADDGTSLVSIPVQLNYLLGKNGKYYEVGGGITYLSIDNHRNAAHFYSFDGSGTIGTMTFGYRSQPVDGGFNFRASFNPLFDSENFVPFFGLSFGYSFK